LTGNSKSKGNNRCKCKKQLIFFHVFLPQESICKKKKGKN